ncbi:hypothetical protein [Rubrivirga sp. IMCC43871]|uniref:hypothetical protein n=1 Tax=Rubrivirga sp. IMCC43871 TaxID=3391575 RepID=UPI00399007D6
MLDSRTFDPWIGPRYESEGLDALKLLIVGESHYGPAGNEDADFTRRVVQSQGRGERYRLFTATAKLVLGQDDISDTERVSFWDRVAFVNYVQEFVTEDAQDRARPSEDAWAEAREPFLATVEDVSPDAVLVLGKELGSRLPDLSVPVHVVNHPSRFFARSKWQPGVQSFLASARAV